MAKRFPPPEAQARRHKLRVLDGYAVVVVAVLLFAALGIVPFDGQSLALVILAVSVAVFGVVDRMPRWDGEQPALRTRSTPAYSSGHNKTAVVTRHDPHRHTFRPSEGSRGGG